MVHLQDGTSSIPKMAYLFSIDPAYGMTATAPKSPAIEKVAPEPPQSLLTPVSSQGKAKSL